jgi:hypothetical protein
MGNAPLVTETTGDPAEAPRLLGPEAWDGRGTVYTVLAFNSGGECRCDGSCCMEHDEFCRGGFEWWCA